MRARTHISVLVICGIALCASCSGPTATAVTIKTPSGGTAYVIGCEESPANCVEQARLLCPFGETTLKPGVGGPYAPGEDFRTPHTPRPNRRLFKLENWIIRCNRPPIR